jgi:AcrR family transcriptional regulator
VAVETLTRDRVLDAAEDALRRFGPGKTTVVDVARALGVSHGTVYRHFASKAELLDAVLGRWLSRISAPLAVIADGSAGDGAGGGADGNGVGNGELVTAADRLHLWLTTLMQIKHDKARTDPDLFAAYALLRADMHAAIPEHVRELVGQLARIVAAGMERGEFAAGDPLVVARGVWDATNRFHHPAHAHEWGVGANSGVGAGAGTGAGAGGVDLGADGGSGADTRAGVSTGAGAGTVGRAATKVGAGVGPGMDGGSGAGLDLGVDGRAGAGAGSGADEGIGGGAGSGGGGTVEEAFAAVWNLLLLGLSVR